MGVPEEEERKKNYFKKVMAKNFSNLITAMHLYIQESQTPSRISTSRYIIKKLLKDKDKKNLESIKREVAQHVQGISNKINS